MKAVALISGGLDSLLAVKLVEEQGVEVLPLHVVTSFTGRKDPAFVRDLERLYGVKVHRVVDLTREFLPLLLDPPHGFGKNMNPCIDCKILFLRKAREIMEEEGASFVITGEVLGQRPMSQRSPILRLIERETELDGLLLRPLSARLLPPTVPEKEGWVDRERLEAIQGRGRKRQLELAKKYGWEEIPSPAGGCLLTDPAFSRRLKDLLDHLPSGELPSLGDMDLLQVGRHFRLSPGVKLVVGRKEGENAVIQSLATSRDLLLMPRGFSGPTGLLVGDEPKGELRMAASLLARYCKGSGPFTFLYKGRNVGEIEVSPLPPEEVDKWLII